MDNWHEFWFIRLIFNLLGYCSVFLPVYLLVRYFKKIQYENDVPGNKIILKLLKIFVVGQESTIEEKIQQSKLETTHVKNKFFWIVVCTGGLQVSYLTWGLLQERIMTKKYGKSETSEGHNFINSQFLVFVNRILAFFTAMIICLLKSQPRHTVPFFKYSYASFSNILSSWCQYEALRFVSFPMQVMAKASKIIPVMIMGKLVSNKSYEIYEYVLAGFVSFGLYLFISSTKDAIHKSNTITTFSGILLLVGYLIFDSFTSNWQGDLFKSYKMSSFQMMAGVNFFSVILTSVSLIEQGGFTDAIAFIIKYNTFCTDILLLSLCSAIGQLFIFRTIDEFGAVVFTLIMTLRQALAILLSCIFYGHPITVGGLTGIAIVFSIILIKTYLSSKIYTTKKKENVVVDK